MGRVSAAVHD
jgi:hypothetical protein